MCSPISHRNLARMKLAPFGSGSMLLLGTYRRREIVGAVDVADHARIADRNLDERALVGGDELPGALIAAERDQLLVVAPGDADRVTAARAKVRRGKRRSAFERLAHGGNRSRPNERHVGERND